MHLCGVIPGFGHLSTSQLNNFVEIVVNDFIPFWSEGVFYTSTPKHGTGLVCRAGLLPVICDAIAAREVSGFSPVTASLFCTCCMLPCSEIENIDKSQWKYRVRDDHRLLAERWLKATAVERVAITQSHGLRYTPLLKLPYFDPVSLTIVDTMHNFYLGLLETHCRDAMGMNISIEDGDADRSNPMASKKTTPPTLPEMAEARAALLSSNPSALKNKKFKYRVLYYLCLELDLRRGGHIKDLLRELNNWVRRLIFCA
ncbi:hypothetical protein MD484_g8625, partial [Candolleomyces efflorescens]